MASNPFDQPFQSGGSYSTKVKNSSGRTVKSNPFDRQLNLNVASLDYSKQAQDERAGKKPVKKPTVDQTQKPAEKPKASLFSRAANAGKSLVKGAVAGENEVAKGVARILPGGTADLDANLRTSNESSNRITKITADLKAGKITKDNAKKLLKTENDVQGQAIKTQKDIEKSMPTKASIALGAVSTGLDILTAGTASKLKTASTVTKPGVKAVKNLIPLATKKSTKLAERVAGNAAAGTANAAASNAGGEDKQNVATAAATGVLLPEALGLVGKAGAKLFGRSSKVPTKEFIKNQKTDELLKSVQGKAGGELNTHVDPDIAAQHPKATPQHISNVNDLIKKANEENPVFQKTLGRVAKENGLHYHGTGAKGANRTFDKVMREYDGDHTQVKDSLRGTIHVDDPSPQGIKQVIDAVGKEMRITKIKDMHDKVQTGYRDVKLTVETPSGHKGEVILATPEMLKAKHEQGGHDLYKKARDPSLPDAERLEAGQKMNALYDKAHADAMSRLASSSDLPKSSTKDLSASSGDISTAPSRKAPTSSEPPVKSDVSRDKPDGNSLTASKTPSDSKNRGAGKGAAGVKAGSISPTVAEKTQKVNPEASTPADTLKTKVPHKAGNSRVYERLQAEHPDKLTDSVKYTQMSLKRDADKAVELVARDKQQAYRVAMGAEELSDQTSTGVNIALAEKALDEGNHKLYAQLTKNRSLSQTRRGQEIVAEKGSVKDNSVSRYVKELISSRLDKVGKNYLSGLSLKKTSTREQAIKKIDHEVKKAQAQFKRIPKKTLQLKEAQSIIDKLAC